MNEKRNPKWWNPQHESRWEQVKMAFKRDWDQTKHDLGGKLPDMDQDVGDTIKQASGRQPIPPRGQPAYEEAEEAYRFGYGARREYQDRYPNWNDELENQLQQDWGDTYTEREWKKHRNEVRRGWSYDQQREYRKAA